MVDYEKLFFTLFNKLEKIEKELKSIQNEVGELYLKEKELEDAESDVNAGSDNNLSTAE